MAKGVVSTCTYGELPPMSQWVGMIIWNLSTKEVKLPAKSVIGHVQAANTVSKSLAPKPIEEAQPKAEVVYCQDGCSGRNTEAQKPTIQLTHGVPFSNLPYGPTL